MFARELFDYPELEEHPFLCNHLGKVQISLGYKMQCSVMYAQIYITEALQQQTVKIIHENQRPLSRLGTKLV